MFRYVFTELSIEGADFTLRHASTSKMFVTNVYRVKEELKKLRVMMQPLSF